MSFPKIAFIGAGSTVFMKNIVGDVLQWEALNGVHFSLMDINEQRLLESEMVFKKLVSSLEVQATYSLFILIKKKHSEKQILLLLLFK